jgi:hypothetical protein
MGPKSYRDMGGGMEWYECPVCDMLYTWFRIEIVEGVDMYGWLHKTDGDCSRDKGLAFSDRKLSSDEE